MRKTMLCAAAIAAAAASWRVAAQATFDPETIIRLERGALERWGTGDPDGYLELMATNVTYFDPSTEQRVNGREGLKPRLDQIRGKLKIDRTEILHPEVIRDGNVAVLTFNAISHGAQLGDAPKRDSRWSVTEVYRLIDGRWRIVHSHFSNPPAPK